MADIVLCQPATCVEPLGKSDWVLKPGTLRINNYNMYVLRRFFFCSRERCEPEVVGRAPVGDCACA